MHLHWERSTNSAGDCAIQALSWMGKVPEEIPEVNFTNFTLQNWFHNIKFQDEGWKLSRNNYYQEGWLSTANVRGVVGVTYTTSYCGGGQGIDVPARTNYNLRGHRSEVKLDTGFLICYRPIHDFMRFRKNLMNQSITRIRLTLI